MGLPTGRVLAGFDAYVLNKKRTQLDVQGRPTSGGGLFQDLPPPGSVMVPACANIDAWPVAPRSDRARPYRPEGAERAMWRASICPSLECSLWDGVPTVATRAVFFAERGPQTAQAVVSQDASGSETGTPEELRRYTQRKALIFRCEAVGGARAFNAVAHVGVGAFCGDVWRRAGNGSGRSHCTG